MRRVIVESPYGSEDPKLIERNLRYLRACLADCIDRGEAPYASHALYTQPGVLNDNDAEERERGIQAGFAWKDVAHATVVYTDLGIIKGMSYGIDVAQKLGQAVEFRRLEGWNWEENPNFATEKWGR